MIQRFIVLVVNLVLGNIGFASDPPPLPKQVPPVFGTAVVTDTDKGGAAAEWQIGLTVPKIRWTIIGDMVPKIRWPELKAEVEKTSLTLRMGGPSQLGSSRVVDLKGTELSRAEVHNRLAKETTVLVSLSGEMPDPYYLQLIRADALIVILGPRDGYPAPDLLPAKKSDTKPHPSEKK